MSGFETRTVPLGPERSLHVEIEGNGEPILWLHGFTGSAETLRTTSRRLGAGFRHLRVDLLGHGRSDAPADPGAWTMEQCARDLAALLAGLDASPAHVIGYSMGARVGLALAAWHPRAVRSLVAVGARAGFEDPQQRRVRIEADEALADRIEQRGLSWFVDHWMALPLFASQRRLGSAFLERAREQRLRNRPEALARSLRGLGAGAQPPLHAALGGVAPPVLLVYGDEDVKFAASARELAELMPHASARALKSAGHAAHLEAPREFAAACRDFLRKAPPHAGCARPALIQETNP